MLQRMDKYLNNIRQKKYTPNFTYMIMISRVPDKGFINFLWKMGEIWICLKCQFFGYPLMIILTYFIDIQSRNSKKGFDTTLIFHILRSIIIFNIYYRQWQIIQLSKGIALSYLQWSLCKCSSKIRKKRDILFNQVSTTCFCLC